MIQVVQKTSTAAIVDLNNPPRCVDCTHYRKRDRCASPALSSLVTGEWSDANWNRMAEPNGVPMKGCGRMAAFFEPAPPADPSRWQRWWMRVRRAVQ